MGYKRPTNTAPLSKAQKLALLKEYNEHYSQVAATHLSALNRKVPRGTFAELLDQIGGLLVAESEKLAHTPGDVRNFLDANPFRQAWHRYCPMAFERTVWP
jgi:hypothetical protein